MRDLTPLTARRVVDDDALAESHPTLLPPFYSGKIAGFDALQVLDENEGNLSVADLSVADLTGANLTSADLSGAKLLLSASGAELSAAKQLSYLLGANLFRADLTGAKLSGANLTDTTVEQAQLDLACGSDTKLPPGLTLKPCPPPPPG
jgi:uncharacterized protein YjbI with pentapeptide repeats